MARILDQNEKYRILRALNYSTQEALKLRQVKLDETLEKRIGKSWKDLVEEVDNTQNLSNVLRKKRYKRDLTALTKDEKRERYNKERRKKRQEARDKGYAPEEATKMSGWSRSRFVTTILNDRMVDKRSRQKHWSKMSKKVRESQKSRGITNNFEEYFREQIEDVNKRNGFAYDASFGYGVMYNYYIYGESIEFWEKNMGGKTGVNEEPWLYSYSKKARDILRTKKMAERYV